MVNKNEILFHAEWAKYHLGNILQREVHLTGKGAGLRKFEKKVTGKLSMIIERSKHVDWMRHKKISQY